MIYPALTDITKIVYHSQYVRKKQDTKKWCLVHQLTRIQRNFFYHHICFFHNHSCRFLYPGHNIYRYLSYNGSYDHCVNHTYTYTYYRFLVLYNSDNGNDNEYSRLIHDLYMTLSATSLYHIVLLQFKKDSAIPLIKSRIFVFSGSVPHRTKVVKH